ncbi:MAG: DM13 domain-containing protein [Candidatus Thiodiazotropha sp.]
MKVHTIVLLIATHGLVGLAGFGAGIYALPILTAPPAPSASEITAMSTNASYTAEFNRDLEGSDALHWGEGTVSVGPKSITLMGKLAPGPDYKLYLSPEFVETESDFNRLKANMVRVGDVKTFENFIVNLPPTIDPENFNSVIVWCESFGQFISSAKYR